MAGPKSGPVTGEFMGSYKNDGEKAKDMQKAHSKDTRSSFLPDRNSSQILHRFR